MADPQPIHDSAGPGTDGRVRSDVNIQAIALFGAGLIVLAVGVHFFLGALMNVYSDRQASMVGSTRPLSDTLSKASEPQLQVVPADELRVLRSTEETVLNSYGWVDRKAGVVRIPIDRAIDLLTQRGLPARDSASTKSDEKRAADNENGEPDGNGSNHAKS